MFVLSKHTSVITVAGKNRKNLGSSLRPSPIRSPAGWHSVPWR